MAAEDVTDKLAALHNGERFKARRCVFDEVLGIKSRERSSDVLGDTFNGGEAKNVFETAAFL
jgi:hypothetical protein